MTGEPGAAETHFALFYEDEQEYLDGVLGFVAPAVSADEPIAAAVPPDRGELLRRALDGARIEILDMYELGRNPARIIPKVQAMLTQHDGEQLHYIGEPIWAGRSPEEVHEATRHEALINLAWPGARIRMLCLYDAVALDAAVLADAERTHPRLIRDGQELPSPVYGGSAIPAGSDDQLGAPPSEAVTMSFGLEDLFGIRALVSEQATGAGVSPDRASDLVLAVNELVTNSIRHGGEGGTLHVWRQRGQLLCQVGDGGHITDPLAGRQAPVPDVAGGLGLWTVNQLCDLVELRTGESGTTVRVHTTLN